MKAYDFRVRWYFINLQKTLTRDLNVELLFKGNRFAMASGNIGIFDQTNINMVLRRNVYV